MAFWPITPGIAPNVYAKLKGNPVARKKSRKPLRADHPEVLQIRKSIKTEIVERYKQLMLRTYDLVTEELEREIGRDTPFLRTIVSQLLGSASTYAEDIYRSTDGRHGMSPNVDEESLETTLAGLVALSAILRESLLEEIDAV
jgi:hypothetical protein